MGVSVRGPGFWKLPCPSEGLVAFKKEPPTIYACVSMYRIIPSLRSPLMLKRFVVETLRVADFGARPADPAACRPVLLK